VRFFRIFICIYAKKVVPLQPILQTDESVMKKIVVFLCVLAGTMSLFAQENTAVTSAPSGIITKVDDNYILGDKTMSKDEYLTFIQQNCTEAWTSYQKGNKLWNTGWGLLGAGIGTFVVGTAVYGVGVYNYTIGNKTPALIGSGAAVMAVGSGLMAGSIPCLIVGGIKRNNSHEVYNEIKRQNGMAVTFGIQPAANGMAMVMQF
jgi:hypothetical protein